MEEDMTRPKTRAIAGAIARSLSKEQRIFWMIEAGFAVVGAAVFAALNYWS